MSQARIVIIGAGASGIACATKLLEYGFQNITILEAEDRIGGRINTIEFAENVIDLGAQWCHGQQDNVVYELAHKHGLLESTGDIYDNYKCIRSNGEVLPNNISQRLKDIVNETLVTRQLELRDYNASLGHYLHAKYYEALRKPENADIDAVIAKEFLTNYEKFENSVEASDTLNEVSGRGYLEYWECEGDILLNWKNKGYIELLRLLMKTEQSSENTLGVLQQHVELRKQVQQINWQRVDGKVCIKTIDGTQLIADHVIVTVSLGVLKQQHMQLFKPSLPLVKQNAIEGLGFGTVNKIFMEFPMQFWPKDWTGCALLWREEDLQEIRGTDKAWLENVFGFYSVNYQPKLLAGWIVGAHGRYMETLPVDEVLTGCMYLLRKFLPWQIPDVVNFKTSAWHSNANFRGSYSFRSMLTEQMNASAKDLAQPLFSDNKMLNGTTIKESTNNFNENNGCEKPTVLFAGEASSEHYYSTVHGAVEAGWREARRLADFYELKWNKEKLPKSQL